MRGVEMADVIQPLVGRVLTLTFLATWGDEDYLGLSGVEVIGVEGLPLTITGEMLSARPASLNELEHCEGDYRTVDKLVDGVNITTDDRHMWLIPFESGRSHTLTITFPDLTQLIGLKIYNYNKCHDDSFRGARGVSISLDNSSLCQGQCVPLRRAPGTTDYDYSQLIELVGNDHNDIEVSQHMNSTRNKLITDYEISLMPSGFVLQIQIYKTWGDPFYVGLNGIELFDENGGQILLHPGQISAMPDSVNVLLEEPVDVR